MVELSPDFTQAHYQLFLLYSRTRQNEQAQTALAEFKRLEELEKEVRREQTRIEKLRRLRYAGDAEVRR